MSVISYHKITLANRWAPLLRVATSAGALYLYWSTGEEIETMDCGSAVGTRDSIVRTAQWRRYGIAQCGSNILSARGRKYRNGVSHQSREAVIRLKLADAAYHSKKITEAIGMRLYKDHVGRTCPNSVHTPVIAPRPRTTGTLQKTGKRVQRHGDN